MTNKEHIECLLQQAKEIEAEVDKHLRGLNLLPKAQLSLSHKLSLLQTQVDRATYMEEDYDGHTD